MVGVSHSSQIKSPRHEPAISAVAEKSADNIDLSQHSFIARVADEISNVSLGKKIARGVLIKFGEGVPALHIKDDSVREILSSLSAHSAILANCVAEYQCVRGSTPSKDGLRVFAAVLRNLSEEGGDSRQKLKAIVREALDLDLAKVADPQWKREVSLTLSGLPVKLEMSIEKRSLFDRVTSRCVGTDLKEEALKSLYAYKVEITPEENTGNPYFAMLKNRLRQIGEVTSIIAPIAIASTAEFLLGASEALSSLSSNRMIKGALTDVSDFGVPIVAGMLVYALRDRLLKKKLG